MSTSAPIIEIFSSYQGEGPRVGERHLFVRFQDCELSCKFCDTPMTFVSNKFCRIESPAFSKHFKNVPNPISKENLNELITEFDDKVLVLTGGEPLQKVNFLREWLPTLNPRRKVMLETAGVHFGEFIDIEDQIDIVSMDFKLPSTTGMHPWWREHESFLKAAHGKEIYIKLVVSSETQAKDIDRTIEMLTSIDPNIPVIVQPATLFGRFRLAPSLEQVATWETRLQKSLSCVRVIPQVHKQMGAL